jgi:glycosyltransferase involved in cell wall biosynthesis
VLLGLKIGAVVSVCERRRNRIMRPFVVGFFGARDGYELPLALQEGGLLGALLTDFYGARGGLWWWPARRKQLAKRSHAHLSNSLVHSSWALGALQHAAHRLIRDPERAFEIADRALSSRIGRLARKRDANILTYEPHAVKLTSDERMRGIKQVIFYCHPHVDAEDAIVRKDRERFGEFYVGHMSADSPWRRRTADAWREADSVLCASSYTKKTLVQAGMDARRCHVVPYGSSQQILPSGENTLRQTDKLRVLFVGRRPLRKGLHHLLLAWKAANLGERAELSIVAPRQPQAVYTLAKSLLNVRWQEVLSAQELGAEYERSHLLAVPSLSEGFGHVYLEAMARGCSVLGTASSALPDFGGEDRGVFLTEVGDIECMAETLHRLSQQPDLLVERAAKVRAVAAEFTWEKFRSRVRSVLHELGS